MNYFHSMFENRSKWLSHCSVFVLGLSILGVSSQGLAGKPRQEEGGLSPRTRAIIIANARPLITPYLTPEQRTRITNALLSTTQNRSE